MTNVPITQFIVTVLLVAFIVPEVFRFVAGTACTIDFRPLPAVIDRKKSIGWYRFHSLSVATFSPLYFNISNMFLHLQATSKVRLVIAILPILTLSFTAILLFFGQLASRFAMPTFVHNMIATKLAKLIHRLWKSSAIEFSKLTAISPTLEGQRLRRLLSYTIF